MQILGEIFRWLSKKPKSRHAGIRKKGFSCPQTLPLHEQSLSYAGSGLFVMHDVLSHARCEEM